MCYTDGTLLTESILASQILVVQIVVLFLYIAHCLPGNTPNMSMCYVCVIEIYNQQGD